MTYFNIKTTQLFELLAIKMLKIDDNKVFWNSNTYNKVDKIDKILTKFLLLFEIIIIKLY